MTIVDSLLTCLLVRRRRLLKRHGANSIYKVVESLVRETVVALKLSKQAMPQELNADPETLKLPVGGVAWRVLEVLFSFCRTERWL